MDATKDSILIDGNTSAALGALYAGATVGAWYPITPATSLMEAFRGFCKKYRRDPETKKNLACILQAEDELAAIGMVIGASWAGARAFTPTAGPGISLMNEFIGLAYYAEIPAVVFDVQRTGPSTGMPTRTQQGDLLLCAYASHGDTRHICLYPADPREAFELAVKAFDLADRFQTPVFVLSDLDIGMNDWMVPKLTWDDSYRPDRGKVLSADDLEKMKTFYRYLDQRRRRHPLSHAAGHAPERRVFHPRLGPQQVGGYTEDDDEYTEVIDRVGRKIQSATRAVPAPVVQTRAGRQDGHRHRRRVPWRLRRSDGPARQGRRGARLHARARLPFGDDVRKFLESHEVNFIVEQNRDGQLRSLLMLETGVARREAGIGALLRRLPDERAPRDLWREGQARASGVEQRT